ncbi:MAG: alanine--tRNA ligase [Armatimonadota bacterium]
MTVRELREKYLRFFESQGHTIHDSGSLIPIDVTGRLDESLLFNGAGMIQFKPYFRGIATPPHKRLVTAQKCVRTGDIEEVGDESHLTFFEMLGNFSFGDYFKAEAIAYSWEFLTSKEWLGLDPKRLSFTVFEDDDEAYSSWSSHISQAGIDPTTRIFRLGDETNYWPAGSFSKGPPGPCGPNSEMFYWTNPETVPGTQAGDYSRDQWIADDEAKNWLEIWNDVFIQFEWQGNLRNPERPSDGWEKTGMPNLPFKSIDTGMGMERTVAVLEGKSSVYDTDAFTAILAKIDALRGARTDSGTLTPTPLPPKEQGEGTDVQMARRVIADHIRTSCFCIADGIMPANNGRGYVLRRLIRRAVLKGQRVLGFNDLFMHEVADAVIDTFGDHYKELKERKSIIEETLKSEEDLFRRTLHRGSELLEDELAKSKGMLTGAMAFQLYDTFGFPLEVTQEICSEKNVTVDLEGYEGAMKEAQERSRGAQGEKSAYGDLASEDEHATPDAPTETEFLGYQNVHGTATLVRVRPSTQGKYRIALDQTPFYGESGGQTGDTGELRVNGNLLIVENTTKSSGTFWHEVIGTDVESLLGKPVEATVDAKRRARIKRNHTATHLLQAALRQVLGTTVTQAGSYVGPDNLRFDFTYGKGMTSAEIAEVEQIVNEQALANTSVTTYVDLPIDEARAKGAMALFGEKYGDKVRMVEIGEFSKELCGGTHVRTTGEIGLFKIVSESSAASGVRRIEAITGEAAYELFRNETEAIKQAAGLLKANPKELVSAVERTVDQLKDERKKREKAEMAAMSGGSAAANETKSVNGVDFYVKNLGDADPKVASQALDNEANGKPNQVTLLAVVSDKVTFMCKVGPDAQAKGAHAGNLLKELARIAGGGGGGQAAFATAGGRDPSKAEEALAAAEAVLAGQI